MEKNGDYNFFDKYHFNPVFSVFKNEPIYPDR